MADTCKRGAYLKGMLICWEVPIQGFTVWVSYIATNICLKTVSLICFFSTMLFSMLAGMRLLMRLSREREFVELVGSK